MNLRLLESEDAFELLSAEWRSLLDQNQPAFLFQTPEWQVTWWETFGSGCDLYIIEVRDQAGTLLGIAPLYRSREDGQQVLRIIGGIEVSDYLDLIGRQTDAPGIWAEIGKHLASAPDDWDILDLHCIPEESPSRQLAPMTATCEKWGSEGNVEEVCPVIFLPGSWDEYLLTLSKKDRHELRRKMRRLENEVEQCRFYHITEAEDLEDALTSFIRLHQLSSREKSIFMDSRMEKFFRAMARRLLPNGWLKMWFLEVERQRVAAVLAFDCGDGIYLYNSGYDPDYSRLSVGVVLLGEAIKESIANGKRVFDFMRGPESYKYDFGARDTQIYNIRISKTERS
jgi:CelD/BcsL family acetyltransferase involved in cellulose biosynthesis